MISISKGQDYESEGFICKTPFATPTKTEINRNCLTVTDSWKDYAITIAIAPIK